MSVTIWYTRNKGCPVLKDSDNDGIFDQQDLCPLQPGPIENKGCPQLKQNDPTTIIKYISDLAANVYFDTGKWSLKEDSKEVLNKMVQYIKEVPEIKFIVEGHTDNRDRNQFNLYLSQKRADAVRKYLLRKGVKAEQLSFVGYGETRPKYSNETPEGRQLNRRVEVKPATELDRKINLEEKSDEYQDGFHMVKEDETLFSISNKYGISIQKIRSLNNLKSDVVKVGQKLKLK